MQLQFSSATTAALQQHTLHHSCFAALHADVRRRVRKLMMGWPADARRFLAGAFAGGNLAVWAVQGRDVHMNNRDAHTILQPTVAAARRCDEIW